MWVPRIWIQAAMLTQYILYQLSPLHSYKYLSLKTVEGIGKYP